MKDGKIIAVENSRHRKEFDATEKLDAQGKFIYPGFIDAHAHFVGYGMSLQRLTLPAPTAGKSV